MRLFGYQLEQKDPAPVRVLADDASKYRAQDVGDDEEGREDGHVLPVLVQRYQGWRQGHDYGEDSGCANALESSEYNASCELTQDIHMEVNRSHLQFNHAIRCTTKTGKNCKDGNCQQQHGLLPKDVTQLGVYCKEAWTPSASGVATECSTPTSVGQEI